MTERFEDLVASLPETEQAAIQLGSRISGPSMAGTTPRRSTRYPHEAYGHSILGGALYRCCIGGFSALAEAARRQRLSGCPDFRKWL
jgi:hypothetical protein